MDRFPPAGFAPACLCWLALTPAPAALGQEPAFGQAPLPAPAPLPTDGEPGRSYVEPPAIPDPPAGLGGLTDGSVGSPAAGPTLGLDDLLALATENNPTLRQARSQVAGALGKALQAGLWPNPVLMYVGEKIGSEGTAGEFQGFEVRQEFVTADKRQLSRAKYLARARAGELLALAQQYRVCNDVRVHFFRALGRRDRLEIRRELLKSAEDGVVTARELYNEGQENVAGVRRANVALQRTRLDLLMAENQYQRAVGELTSLTGADLGPVTLAGELAPLGDVDPLDFHELLFRLYEQSPEVLAAKAKLNADRITVRREIVEPVPNVVVTAGPGYNFEAEDAVANVGIALEIPIWNRNQGTIRQAEADLARQGREVRRVELVLRRRLFEVYQDYLTGLQHVVEYRDVILPEAKAAYRAQLESYREDRQDWPDVLDAQREYFDLRHEYVERLTAWRENEVLLAGFLLHGGLDAPMNPTPPGHIDAVPQPR